MKVDLFAHLVDNWLECSEERIALIQSLLTWVRDFPVEIYLGEIHVASAESPTQITFHPIPMREERINRVMEKWRETGLGQVLRGFTQEEIAEINRRCALEVSTTPRRPTECRISRKGE